MPPTPLLLRLTKERLESELELTVVGVASKAFECHPQSIVFACRRGLVQSLTREGARSSKHNGCTRAGCGMGAAVIENARYTLGT